MKKMTAIIISLIVSVVCLTSCQKTQQERLLDRAEHRIETILNSEANRFCLIHSSVSSGRVNVDTLGIFTKDWLMEFEEYKKNDGFSGRYFEGVWHSFEWKSLKADEFAILKDTIHYHSGNKELVVCDMVIPMSGKDYRIKNVTIEWAEDYFSNSLLFEIEKIVDGKADTYFKRLLPGATELVTAEGWTNLRETKDGDYTHHEVDWFENGKYVRTYSFTTKIIDWTTKDGWTTQKFNVHGGAIEYHVNWCKNGEVVKRIDEHITDKELPISEWEKLC